MWQKEITLRGPARRERKSRPASGGFTLLEVLIAVVIIALIVSIVYGSYFATARSTQAYDATLELSAQARAALAQIARQIRCAYVPPSEIRNSKFEIRNSGPEARASLAENAPRYFSGGVDGPAGEVLHLVTADASLGESDSTHGLFEAVYRFDRTGRQVSLSQQRFIERLDGAADYRNWQPVLTGVEHIELTFYDGQKWLPKWDFKEKRGPPLAVKIDITCQDKNYRCYRYATTAYVACHKNQGKKAADYKPISIEEEWD